MITVSRLEVVFSKSNVCFGPVVFVPGDGGLVTAYNRLSSLFVM